MIAGSGPTDRDGNSAALPNKNNSLRLLAEALAGQDYASLRYDKRGVGESRGTVAAEVDLRFDDYVNDAVGWANQLASDKRFSRLIIAGHSEGSLIGMLALQRAPAAMFISLEGPGRPAQEILASQLKGKLPPDLEKTAQTILASLSQAKTYEPAPPAPNFLFRPSVQPYLISWFKYDPAKEIAKLKIPVLVVQGSTDFQIFKDVPADQAAQVKSYSDPSLPIDPTLVSTIAAFIRSHEHS